MQNPFPSDNPLVTIPYDPEKDREKVRGRITYGTLIGFFLILVAFGLMAWHVSDDKQWARIKEAMGSIFPAITSIVGVITGFYFGAQKK